MGTSTRTERRGRMPEGDAARGAPRGPAPSGLGQEGRGAIRLPRDAATIAPPFRRVNRQIALPGASALFRSTSTPRPPQPDPVRDRAARRRRTPDPGEGWTAARPSGVRLAWGRGTGSTGSARRRPEAGSPPRPMTGSAPASAARRPRGVADDAGPRSAGGSPGRGSVGRRLPAGLGRRGSGRRPMDSARGVHHVRRPHRSRPLPPQTGPDRARHPSRRGVAAVTLAAVW
jgi:hypothetical protein